MASFTKLTCKKQNTAAQQLSWGDAGDFYEQDDVKNVWRG